MFLKHISISGFKSFADKVDLAFGPGVTCIVGPNGCGKSNVVDAFRWVLGEQSAKSLRGRQMQDMIFNGSESRRSAGMAQIEVTLDNADRMLPLDCEAVSVTRKLYRSGESEYFLNKEPARLKDIRELFLDTGIGTEAYSVIEQGKVDVLLRANPVERRVIFEEAAGVSRYKARRKEAERKLDRTQQNLLRVADIIEEVERQLRSVKLQAGKARNFQAYDARLKELRSSFAMAEFHRLSGEIGGFEELVRADTDSALEVRSRIDQGEADLSRLAVDTDKVGEQLSATENERVRVQSEVTALEERIAAARRRIVEQTENLDKARSRHEQGRSRAGELSEEAGRLERQAEELQQRAAEQRTLIDHLNQQDQALARDLTQSQAVLEDIKAGIIDLLRRTARVHNEIAGLDQHVQSLSGQKGRLAVRSDEISRELADLVQTRVSLESRLTEVDGLIVAETQRLEEKRAEASRVDKLRHDLAEHLATLKEQRSGLLSRRQLLHDLELRMEGVGAGVRKLLEDHLPARAEGLPGPVHGIVADLLDADVVHAAIIEAALGELDQLLVVSSSQTFLSDPNLFQDLPGRLTAVALDRLPPVINPRDFSSHAGFVAPAIQFVSAPEPLQQLARHLLGKTVVVETLRDALGIADADTDGHRFVTLAGEVVEPNGFVSLGPTSSRAGLISRKSELRAIDGHIEETALKIDRAADQLNRTSAEAGHLAEVQQELRTAIYEAHTAKVEAGALLQNVMESIRRLTTEQPLITGEVASLEQQISEAAQRTSTNRQDLDRLDEEKRVREQDVATYQERIDDIVRERERLGSQLTEARVMDGQLGEKRRAAMEAIGAVRRSLREAEESVAAAEHEAADCAARIVESESAVLDGNEQLAALHLKGERLLAEAIQLRHGRDLLRAEADELTAAVKRWRSELEEVESRLHATQMSLSEVRVRREELSTRVRDELGIDLAERYATYEHTEADWEAVEREIAELRAKIDRLGNVNLDAIGEQEELEKRQEFLVGQRRDLDESHRQLVELIEKLNVESRDRFMTAFVAIRENFQELFRKLFGGGKADIILENPEDPLECGIEIVARPPGKELQSITLMSGGEKTMTAIALVMSIFRSRPSPFAILDEVDAALDEANNVRFNNIVREFLDRSQFIIITHSKRTMGVADHMYGITMQEPGVSTLVSVRFEGQEGARVASGAVA